MKIPWEKFRPAGSRSVTNVGGAADHLGDDRQSPHEPAGNITEPLAQQFPVEVRDPVEGIHAIHRGGAEQRLDARDHGQSDGVSPRRRRRDRGEIGKDESIGEVVRQVEG